MCIFHRSANSDNKTVSMTIRIVLKTGLFREAYAAGYARQTVDKTWYDFQVLMCKQCCLHRLTSETAGSFGYGKNTHDAADNAAFEGMVANGGAARAAN